MKKITLALFCCALLGAATVSHALTSNGYEYVKPRLSEGLLSEDRGTIPYYWKFELGKKPKQGEVVELTFSFSPTEDVENVGVRFTLTGVELMNGEKDYYEKGFKLPGIVKKGEYKTYKLKLKFVDEHVILCAVAGGNGLNYSKPSWLDLGGRMDRIIINTVTKQYGSAGEVRTMQAKDPAFWGNPTGYSAKEPWYGPVNLRKDMETFKQAVPGLSDIDARWLVDKAEYLSFSGKCDKRLDDNCGKIMAEIYKKNPFEDKRNPLFLQMRLAIINEMLVVFKKEAKKKDATLLDVLIIEANDWKKNRPEEKFILPPGPLDEGGSPINSIYPEKDTKASVTVSGRFVFQKHVVTKAEGITTNTVAVPIRRALIWVWGNEPTPTYLGKTMTLDDGSFSINVTTTLNPPHLYAVIHMTGPTSVGLDAYMVKVLADTAYQYPTTPATPFWRFKTELLTSYSSPGIYDFGTTTLPVYSSSNTQPQSGAANIFDALMQGCGYFYPGRVNATTMGKVKALWEPNFK